MYSFGNMADKTAKYKILNGSKQYIAEDSIMLIEPDTTEPDGIGYMQIGTTFRIS